MSSYDENYQDPSDPGFYPYWCGRVSQALRYLLEDLDGKVTATVATEALAGYDRAKTRSTQEAAR